MKKLLLFTFSLLLIISSLSAQRVGFSGGMSLIDAKWTINNNTINTRSNIGYQFGTRFEFDLSDKFYINTGLNYTLKGYLFKAEENNVTHKLKTLNIPLHFAYKISLFDKWSLVPQVGVYMGYLISNKFKSETNYTNDASFNKLDYGFRFGIGYQCITRRFFVTYELGLKNISSISNESIKNSMISFTFSYMVWR